MTANTDHADESDESAEAESGALCPIPIKALKIADRSAFEAQTVGSQPAAEGQQRMAGGQEPKAQTDAQVAAGQQRPMTEARQQAPATAIRTSASRSTSSRLRRTAMPSRS